ncbi:dihydroneopterin triphosphate pyrophosphatase [Rubripirellula lacrimiformis]|uniref:Dihydroneopterin triphosphate pyrophosphatase n=1 Tax=Rubripirellula lacrimiformis TaxID=1930273 RepID=A0A517N5R4_9BACT|nr:NUDIX domain-containing protein [Rubripirellula lacrimiformis]QDT02453.1 dihydroneopterin triphosphate pyrophosphatase [Rubripirellula lacrimiformis]
MKKTPGQTVRAAGILLICDRDRPTQFLLMRHKDRWDLPKGHCEKDETFQQTALRETEEETGIAADRITLDPTFQFDLQYQVRYKNTGDTPLDKHVRYFIGYVGQAWPLTLTEHESAQWMAWAPPTAPIQSETIDPLLAAAAEHLAARK